jgi:hypothetical protein
MDAKDITRFNSKYVRGADDECWEWSAAKNKGYGVINIKKNIYQSHRLALYLATGEWGVCACHKCDNPSCVNPSHLWWGTKGDNNRDCIEKGRGNKPKGVEASKSKLTEQQVLDIRRIYAEGKTSHRKLAVEYGIDHRSIGRLIKNKNWKHI